MLCGANGCKETGTIPCDDLVVIEPPTRDGQPAAGYATVPAARCKAHVGMAVHHHLSRERAEALMAERKAES